ncbi:hypothetical protein D3C71_1613470 [compost metagenome]
MIEGKTKQLTHQQSGCHRRHRAHHQRDEHTDHALDQNHPVHAKNTADHQAGDHKVQQIGVFHQQMDGTHHVRLEKIKVHQHRRHHQAQNGRAANITQYRNAFT